jgi:hypothetical protein
LLYQYILFIFLVLFDWFIYVDCDIQIPPVSTSLPATTISAGTLPATSSSGSRGQQSNDKGGSVPARVITRPTVSWNHSRRFFLSDQAGPALRKAIKQGYRNNILVVVQILLVGGLVCQEICFPSL